MSAQPVEQHYLLFAARGASLRPYSFAGHAFVSWGTHCENDSIVRAPLTLGFFPVHSHSKSLSFFFDYIPSEIVPGFSTNSRRVATWQVGLWVEADQWQTACDTAWAWQNRRYSLLHRNCVSFMDAIADAAGLKTPAIKVLGFPRRPKRYLKRLVKMNALHIRTIPPVRYEDGQPAKEVITQWIFLAP